MVDPDEHDNSNDCDVCPDGQYRIQNIILLLVSIVLQVNTYQVVSPVIMRASLTVKYVITVDIRMKMAVDLAPGVLGMFINDDAATTSKHDSR